MPNKTYQIKIESILGGHSQMSHYSGASQFLDSLGIDPSYSIMSSGNKVSGMLCPVPTQNISAEVLGNIPMWIIPEPKVGSFYVYGANGSVYSLSNTTLTALSDGGSMSGASGNGAEYYDNYIYFAKDTTIARYGPLNGTPAFNGDYWVTTLSKTALTDQTYPTAELIGLSYPNHILHRHSDGKLYIGDVVGNQGYIHYIATTKTTVEGDTNDGSTYQKLEFGFGLYPTAIESYGNDLVIALWESGAIGTSDKTTRAKLAFWDTTSLRFNKIIWVEFPDGFITSIRSINGVLYIFSCDPDKSGFRISKFLGGSSFERINYFQGDNSPFHGATASSGGSLLFGTSHEVDDENTATGSVFSIGGLGDAVFNVMRSSSSTSSFKRNAMVTALAPAGDFEKQEIIAGWSDGNAGVTNNGLDKSGDTDYLNTIPQIFRSQLYKIPAKFKITKIRIPLGKKIQDGTIIEPKIYIDNGTESTTLETIKWDENYPNKKVVVIRPNGLTGENDFFLQLKWLGSSFTSVQLPIIIDYEIIPD